MLGLTLLLSHFAGVIARLGQLVHWSICLLSCQHDPDDTGVFVRDRNQGLVIANSAIELNNPLLQMMRLVWSLS